MVSLIGVNKEKIKEAFLLFAEDCKNFSKILKEEKTKANETVYSSNTINSAIERFEREYNGKPIYLNLKS